MKIKFLKDYRYPGGGYSNKGDVQTFEDAAFAKWAIDNGFAEKVEEGVEWLYDGASYYEPAVSGLSRKFVPSYDEYCVDDAYDEARRRIGICYKSRAACQRFIDFLTAVETVRHDEGFMTRQSDGMMGWAIYLKDDGQLGAMVTSNELAAVFRQHAGEFYFDTEKHAIASGEKHPNEWRTILDYDWSKGEDGDDED